MSRHPISSGQTFVMKWIFPIVWIGAFASATIALFVLPGSLLNQNGGGPPESMKWAFLAGTIGGGAFILMISGPLKRIAMDDGNLYVSNYRREIVIPLRDVESVTENRWINIHPVTLHLRRESEFGSAIRSCRPRGGSTFPHTRSSKRSGTPSPERTDLSRERIFYRY